jgi:hypothetical protein
MAGEDNIYFISRGFMPEDFVSVIDIAKHSNKRRQSIFKIIKKLNIETIKENSSLGRGQAISYVSKDDEARIYEYLRDSSIGSSDDTPINFEVQGVFYLIQLEPHHDPGRFKVGFATSIKDRVKSHKCSAPLLELIKTWPCKLLWEKTAIDCITSNCQKIHTEVFRTDSIDSIKEKGDRFFSLMPSFSDH